MATGTDAAKVTIRDVAERAGVSPATVSNVLNERYGMMRDETLARVRAAIVELGFVPSGTAKALRTSRSRVLGLVVPSIANPYFAQLARGAEDETLARGYALFVCSSDRSPERERALAQVLFERGVDAAIFASSVMDHDHVAKLRQRGIGVIVFESETADPDADVVLYDNAGAARMAVEHLADLGHRRIAYATGPLTRQPRQTRLSGYLEGLRARGLPIDQALIVEGPLEQEPRTGSYEVTAGRQIAEGLLALADPPTAVLAFNDMAALGVMRGFQAAGVSVPAEMSVIGIDDIAFGELVQPSLTTVQQPSYEKGAAAVRLLLDHLAGGNGREPLPRRTIRFEPRLIVRESTVPPGRNRR